MKKVFSVFFLAIIASLVFAGTSGVLTGVADCTNEYSLEANPASVFLYNQDSRFVLKTGVSNAHVFKSEPFVFKPEAYLRASFIGPKVVFSIDVDSHTKEEPSYGEKTVYDIQRDVVFSFGAAFGFGNLGFGFGAYGGSSMEQQNVTDLFSQSIFGEYTRLEESQFFNVRFGAVYKILNLSVGFNMDNLLSYSGNEQYLSFSKILDGVSFGINWNRSKYAKRGRLNTWVFNTSAELQDFFNRDNRTLALGAEAVLQLMSDYSISVNSGAAFAFSDFTSPTLTAGVGARLNVFNIEASAEMPLSDFSYDRPFKVRIDFSFIN